MNVKKHKFEDKYVLFSQGEHGNKWCRYFPYLPANTREKLTQATDYKLTDGEYIICKHLVEVIKLLRGEQ